MLASSEPSPPTYDPLPPTYDPLPPLISVTPSLAVRPPDDPPDTTHFRPLFRPVFSSSHPSTQAVDTDEDGSSFGLRPLFRFGRSASTNVPGTSITRVDLNYSDLTRIL